MVLAPEGSASGNPRTQEGGAQLGGLHTLRIQHTGHPELGVSLKAFSDFLGGEKERERY